MRLKHLELQGYKTFASRTEFVFDGGITAIVGPNGSGKSNVADSIRWVLGEQSYRSLRGKRTEDMIFSGSTQRARLGMASASLLLDNTDGWLPIDFSEVTVTRRAYRSGENEYLLNGKRVRLRDITELFAQSGLAQRTYTVVGQGFVDAVLSLRPEDRRALFEEAAGIALYRSKRSGALARLDETRSNLVRVNDIVNEIAPRLRRLERQAALAERHSLLSQQLEGLLRTWYGYRWRQFQLDLRRARDALARREAHVDRQRRAMDAVDERIATVRVQQSELREKLGSWHREGSDLHRQMEGVQRDLAVWHERSRLLARQSEELQVELADLEMQFQITDGRISGIDRELASSAAELGESEAQVARAQEELNSLEGKREGLSKQMAELQARAFDAATRSADRRNRLEQLGERRVSLAQEMGGHNEAIATRQTQATALRSRIVDAGADRARIQEEVTHLEAETGSLREVLVGIQAEQGDLRAAFSEAERGAERLETRLDLLTRLREEGDGLHGGVRAVLQAARGMSSRADSVHASSSAERQTGAPAPIREGRTPLYGILGTVAQFLTVPETYEVAIEVALGGHLQDLVVESWSHAEAAIEYLRDEKAGRATFLPLDTVRPTRRLAETGGHGVVGVGADLVRADERFSLVVEMLLGRTIVVENLQAARHVFDRLRGGFQVVTQAGEVLRSNGSLTGGEGRGRTRGQLLARERELRELPAELADAQGLCSQIESALAEALAGEERARESLSTFESRLRMQEQELTGVKAGHNELEREAGNLGQRIAWRLGLVDQLDGESTELDALEAQLQSDLDRLAEEQKVAEAEAGALQIQLDQLRGEALYERVSEARTASAVARGTWEHHRETLMALRERHSEIRSQVEAKRERISALQGERMSLLEQIEDRASRETVIQGWLASLDLKIEPVEVEVTRLEAESEGLASEETTLRGQLRDAESDHGQAALTQGRQEDRLQRLRRQISDDFGLVELEWTDGLPEQPPLPFSELVSALPVVEQLPSGVEEEIRQIRAQMKRMRSVNPRAPDEFAAEMDRYEFLTEQAADLEEAATRLNEVIEELDEVMRREFQATFEEVEVRFSENFTRLFGGGSARLALTEPEDVSRTGVEIVASPPGKRLQTLALLSGGERSLTAVALIFALLDTSPPPFCILDEVDAMLDEANVKRFRQVLAELAEQTQFIVITHNRTTIEAANTIYGVSMGEDSVSQVVSIRMDGDHLAAPDGSTVEMNSQ